MEQFSGEIPYTAVTSLDLKEKERERGGIITESKLKDSCR
jgi:hypothetical protein